jgi:hypothetical protein
LLGQQEANWAALGKASEMAQTPDRLAQSEAMLEQMRRNASEPAGASLLEAFECVGNILDTVEPHRKRLNAFMIDALKTAWEQPNQLEKLAFFQGLVEGLSKSGLPPHGTDATPIYQRLWLHRRIIDEIKSVAELRAFLLSCGLSENVLGRPDRRGRFKRLEKICEHLGLSFAKPGRPKTAE